MLHFKHTLLFKVLQWNTIVALTLNFTRTSEEEEEAKVQFIGIAINHYSLLEKKFKTALRRVIGCKPHQIQ